MKLDIVKKKLASLESKHPEEDEDLLKQRAILSKCTDTELDRLGSIVEKREANPDYEMSVEESAFWEDLVNRYA